MVSSPRLTLRPLEPADAEASRRLGFEAFGTPVSPPTEPASIDLPGRVFYGVFRGDRLIGRLGMSWKDWACRHETLLTPERLRT